MTQKLTWNCDHCGNHVEDGTGYLHISYAEINRREKEYADWNQKQRSNVLADSHVRVITAAELMTAPALAQWQISHTDCDPAPESNDWHVPITYALTYRELIDLTAHLMGKTWINSTNWPELLRQAYRSAPVVMSE